MESTDQVPILLLDVDGVLNAPRMDLPPGWERGRFNGFVLSWNPTVTARLRALHDAGRVEIQWLTTWTQDADRLLAEPMGLPRGLRVHARNGVGPTGYSGPLGETSGWWKLAVARDVASASPERRIVWIDDDLAARADDVEEWLAANEQVLAIAPATLIGLTHEQLDQVESWL